MQDGYTQVGAGDRDMRVAGNDLQHYRQARTADESHMPVRRVVQNYNDGGPMRHTLNQEKIRHEAALGHHRHHLERHQGRHYDSQHGHDNYKY